MKVGLYNRICSNILQNKSIKITQIFGKANSNIEIGVDYNMDSRFDNGYNIVEEWERKRKEKLLQEQRLIKRKLWLRTIAGILVGVLFSAGIFSAGYFFRGNPFDVQPVSTLTSDLPTKPASEVTTQIQLPDPTTGSFGTLPDSTGQNNSTEPVTTTTAPPNETASDLISLTLESATGSDMTVADIYEKVSPSIVGVKITFQSPGYSFGRFLIPDQEQSGEGSGIIISSDGYIMTNYHVVSSVVDNNTKKPVEGSKIEVFLPGDDSKTAFNATLIGFDINTDLAVIKIEKDGLVAAELGNPDELRIGELAVAIGNPGGMEYMSSCTVGYISGLNRSIRTEGYKNIQLIQTDAAINPGNSGGALINSKGQVIGVNSVKIAASSFEGLGFAIPIDTAVEVCNDLINYRYVKGRPQIGISVYSQYTEELAVRYNMPKGVYVYDIEENGPAAKAGILSNDIIVRLGDTDIENFDKLEETKNKYKPNDTVDIRVYRDWSTIDYTSGVYVDLRITFGEMTN